MIILQLIQCITLGIVSIMANLLIYNILYGRVATYYKQLKKTISKLHKPSSSVAFIKKALYNNITSTFAKIKGQF